MTDDRQERIRQRAHAIWEQAGRPDGSHQQHWDQATADIDGENSQPMGKTARLKKPTAANAKGSKPHKINPKAASPRKASAD
ncbi:DUF2934 domain-containing protein [Mesorhizobium sp. M0938]|uniref:DUF2934 domain-containing protein n=1 Tax=unclassified Mesorhizobium TaxID=325217 RepID=UPI0033389FEE